MMPTNRPEDDWGDKTHVMQVAELPDADAEEETVVMSRSYMEALGLLTERDAASTIPDDLSAPVDETHLEGVDEKTLRAALSPNGVPEIKG